MNPRSALAACLLFFSLGLQAQNFPVDTIHKSGSVDNRVNIVILGDGFTAEELPKFSSEAKKFASFFLDYAPYNRYRNYFNIVSIGTPSKESGISNPGTAPDAYPDQPVVSKDTYFGASFGTYIHRLVTISRYTELSNLLAVNFPSYDLVVILANTHWYGGSGGSFAIHTLHGEANKIGVHEIGHALTHLNDEYWAGPGYGWEAPNMTENQDPGSVKWKNWLNTSHVGIFRHGDGEAASWYKPASNHCLMEVLHQGLCNVCREATVERILELVDPVESITPANKEAVVVNESGETFKLDLLRPEPNSLLVEWRLDGALLPDKTEQIVVPASRLNSRISSLTATVFDSTFLSRQDERKFKRARSVTWQLVRSGVPVYFRIEAQHDTLCQGENTVLTALGCPGKVLWSTGEALETIQVNPGETTSFRAICQEDGPGSYDASATITVHPNPKVTAWNTGPYFPGSTIQLRASHHAQYSWSGPDRFISSQQNPQIPDVKDKNAGTYLLEVVDQNGCKARSQTEVTVESPPVVDTDLLNAVQVFPNPARALINIRVKSAGLCEFTLYDLDGRKMLQKSFYQSAEISAEHLDTGYYVYRLSNGSKHTSGKLLLE